MGSLFAELKARIKPLFTQERVAASAGLFLDGLLGDATKPREVFARFHHNGRNFEFMAFA
jgi:hypothetical protein